MPMTPRQLAFLGATFIQTCTINSTFAIVAPFFPLYAVEVGIPGPAVASVFGSFAVAQLAIAPFAGGLASAYGRKRVLTVGVLLVSLPSIAMGLAATVFEGDPKGMVRAMVVLRFVQGAGAAMATTCIFAILTDAFPQNKGAVIGAANACDGAGWAVGPPVGGFLYVAGGFSLPFFVVGPLPLILLALQLAVFPKIGAPPMSPRTAAADSEGDDAEASVYEVEAERIGAAEIFRRAKALLNAPMLMTMAAGAIFTSKWGMFDVTFTPWAVAEFGFSIAEVSVYFSIPAMAFLFISPFGGMVVDKVDHKKRLIGCGFAAIGMSMFTMGPWQLALPWGGRHALLVLYLIAEGVLSPLIMPAMLPDMLDTTRPSNVLAKDYTVDEHTTNIITSFFTTSFNLGGIFGPLLGAYVIPMLGGYTYDSADGLGIDLESTATAEEEGGPPVSSLAAAQLENAFGFRSLLASMALLYIVIAALFLLFECAVKAGFKVATPRVSAVYTAVGADETEGETYQ